MGKAASRGKELGTQAEGGEGGDQAEPAAEVVGRLASVLRDGQVQWRLLHRRAGHRGDQFLSDMPRPCGFGARRRMT